MVARVRAEAFTRAADRRLNALLSTAPNVEIWTRAADRRLNRLLIRAWLRLAAAGRRVGAVCRPWLRWLSRRLRPALVLLLRGFSLAERRLRWLSAAATRVATRASAVITPQRAICGAIVASAACLVASQFIAYRGVEVGQPGYAGLPPVATPPTVGVETAGEAHAYLLIPVAALAAGLAGLAALRPRRRGLGRVVAVLGLLGLAVILLVDRPAGLDAGAQATRFAGATAVLDDGFYAELASAAGLILCGLLLAYTGARKPSLARKRGGWRSARTWFARRRGGKPRTQPDDGLRRPGATMRGRA